MDPIYREIAYGLAAVAFVAAALLPLFGIVAEGGAFVRTAALIGLALVALGLFSAARDDRP